MVPMSPGPLLVLAFLAAPLFAPSAADEERFDPPLPGGYLGVRVVANDEGLHVRRIVAGGAAHRAGLQPGDLVVRFGERTRLGELGVDGFVKVLQEVPLGEAREIEVRRRAETLVFEVEPDPLLLRDVEELASRIQENRYFRSLADRRETLERIDDALLAAARRSRRTQEGYEALNAVLDSLDVSHTAIIPPWTYASLYGGDRGGSAQLHLGLLLQRGDTGEGGDPSDRERYFVQSVMDESPAHRAGLFLGDEIVAANGIPFAVSPRRTLAGYEARHGIYTVQVDRGETVRLEYRRRRGGETAEVEATADVPLGAVRSTKASARLIDARGSSDGGSADLLDGEKLGYIHLWNLLDAGVTRAFGAALQQELAAARGLVIDLRGRGGQVPVLLDIAKRLESDGRAAVLLIDRQTRSAKEVLAYRLKGKPGMTLVGERTAGAVRPATWVKLPRGTHVILPVGAALDVLKLTDGVDLEGRGVMPDVEVDWSLPYAAGRDAILERGIEVLREKVAAWPRRRRV
jgi:C-terminal processing protease CtpA/Prc